MPLTIRHPLPEEDLSPFFGVEHCPLKWNPAQVYVADDGGRLVAIALVFDGGHDVVLMDYVRVLPPWEGKGVWLRLARHILADLATAGKRLLGGYVPAGQVAGMAQRGGATVGTAAYHAVSMEVPRCQQKLL